MTLSEHKCISYLLLEKREICWIDICCFVRMSFLLGRHLLRCWNIISYSLLQNIWDLLLCLLMCQHKSKVWGLLILNQHIQARQTKSVFLERITHDYICMTSKHQHTQARQTKTHSEVTRFAIPTKEKVEIYTRFVSRWEIIRFSQPANGIHPLFML